MFSRKHQRSRFLLNSTDDADSSTKEAVSPLAQVVQRFFPQKQYSPLPDYPLPNDFDTIVVCANSFINRERGNARLKLSKLSLKPVLENSHRWEGKLLDEDGNTKLCGSLFLDDRNEVFTFRLAEGDNLIELRFQGDSQFYVFTRKASQVVKLMPTNYADSGCMLSIVTQQSWRFTKIITIESYCHKRAHGDSMSFDLNMDCVSEEGDVWQDATWEAQGLQVQPQSVYDGDLSFIPALAYKTENDTGFEEVLEFDQADISLDDNGNEVLVLRKFIDKSYGFSAVKILKHLARRSPMRRIVYY